MPLACAGAQRTVLRLLRAPNPKVPVKGGWEERLHYHHEIDLRGGVKEGAVAGACRAPPRRSHMLV